MIDITDAFKKSPTSPEVWLWQSVLHQAFVEALAGNKGAVEYLQKPTRDLAWVCDMAGIKMDSVIAAAKRNINRRWFRHLTQSEKCRKKRNPYKLRDNTGTYGKV
jgi:hypothetical protein